MRKLYFTRHGQTFWNVENKICGATDIGLTDFGHEQAIALGEQLKAEGFVADEILYSPLSRAADTARHISEVTGIPMREEPRLKEQNFGIYEGTPRDGEDFKKAKQCFLQDYEGGESMVRLCQRIFNLLDELKNEPEGKTYLLVAHNGIARAVHAYFYTMSNEEYGLHGIKNCALVEYDFDQEIEAMKELQTEWS